MRFPKFNLESSITADLRTHKRPVKGKLSLNKFDLLTKRPHFTPNQIPSLSQGGFNNNFKTLKRY